MAKTTPLVQFNQVVYQQNGQEHLLTVETSAWYSWLARVTCFIFNSDVGTFTARKESVGNQRGGYYWKAYRRRSGTLYRAYLGKSEELTLQRLNMAAATLAAQNSVSARQGDHQPGEKDSSRYAIPTLNKDSLSLTAVIALEPLIETIHTPTHQLPVSLTPLIGRA